MIVNTIFPILLIVLTSFGGWIASAEVLPNIFSSEQENELRRALASSAGLYLKKPEGIKSSAVEKLVLVSAANAPYVNFFDNFLCFLNRLQFKMLFLALDEKIHNHASSSGNNVVSFHWKSAGVGDINRPALFNTPQFHTITTKKEEGVLQILKMGYNVVFIDLDVALLRDPVPYVLWENIDYVHSLNQICPQ